MAIAFRCPSCGSKISIEEIYGGKTANCPACWDRIPVPLCSTVHKQRSTSRPKDPLDASLPVLIVHGLKLGIRQHSPYFLAGLLLVLFLLFFCCGGAGVLQSLLGLNGEQN